MQETAFFQIAPTTIRWGWLLWPSVLTVVIMAGVMGMAWWTFAGARGAVYAVRPSGLTIQGGLYGRTVPLADLDLSGTRAVNLDLEPELRPKRRTNGGALPGLRTGWFTLHNGRKALVFLTDGRRVVHAPGRGDFDLLLSAVDPEALVRALKTAGGVE